MMKNSKNMNGFQKYLSKPDLFWCANHPTLEHTTGPLWQVHRKHISSSKNRKSLRVYKKLNEMLFIIQMEQLCQRMVF